MKSIVAAVLILALIAVASAQVFYGGYGAAYPRAFGYGGYGLGYGRAYGAPLYSGYGGLGYGYGRGLIYG